jgi:hypothetical protein
MANVEGREIASDLINETWFRKDLYVKGQPDLVPEEVVAVAKMESFWALAKEISPETDFTAELPGGTVDFNNASARAIVKALASGPGLLSTTSNDIRQVDLVNTLNALIAAQWVVPADPPCELDNLTHLNQAFEAARLVTSGKISAYGAVSKSVIV